MLVVLRNPARAWQASSPPIARRRRCRFSQQIDRLALKRPRELLEPIDGDGDAPALVILDRTDRDADGSREQTLGYPAVLADLAQAFPCPWFGSSVHGLVHSLLTI